MKKLFGHNKQKSTKGSFPSRESEEQPIPTPIHQQHTVYLHQQQQHQPQIHQQQSLTNPSPRNVQRAPSEEERWEVLSSQEDAKLLNNYQSFVSRNSSYGSLPPGASPPTPSPNGARSSSPFSISTASSISTAKMNLQNRDRDSQQQPKVIRKKPPPSVPVTLGILGTLDARRTTESYPVIIKPEERFNTYSGHSDNGHRDREKDPTEKKEKWVFWNRDKEKDKDRGKERERLKYQERDKDGREGDSRDELTRMIGYLTATASEDWGLVLEVCRRASANEANAKEAVRALRREFKYGEPAAQLSAARLWAIMLRHSSDLFTIQSTNIKFLETVEGLITSSHTSPVVKERLLDVIAAAAYASGARRNTGFRALWKRVKPDDKPDEGIPFDNDEAMFNPPISGRLLDAPQVAYQELSPLLIEQTQPIPTLASKRRKSPTRNRIIPREEDIRRLFQECKYGQGNAALLSQALALSKPEDLKKGEIIKEFYLKCRASQELIFAQIPWASSGAEQSRAVKDQETLATKGMPGDETPSKQTTEEKLLEALLAANAELVDALSQYEDLERVAIERKAEDRSRKETRMDQRQLQQFIEQDGVVRLPDSFPGRSSPSPSPSRSNSPLQSTFVSHPYSDGNTLAPPPPAPHGPRLPSQASTYSYSRSRTPSPATPVVEDNTRESAEGGEFDLPNGINALQIRHDFHRQGIYDSYEDENEDQVPLTPSAKALGKRKVVEVEPPEENRGEDDMYFDDDRNAFPADDLPESDDSDEADGWQHHRPVRYAYDAVAERTQQRIKEGQAQAKSPLVNGLH